MIKKKEQEVVELVDCLSQLRPTKVALEWDKGEHYQLSEKFSHADRRYEVHEIEQIGFRLAKKLEHNQVYAVDWDAGISSEEMKKLNSAIQNTYPEVLKLMSSVQEKIPILSEESHLLTSFQLLNSRNLQEELEKLYWSFTAIEDGTGDRVGINFMKKWLEREMMIYKNVVDLTDDEAGERIFLLIGSDHLWGLKMLFEQNGWNVIMPFGD
ncbi:DUF5694 domain-containing protein [Bacillus sp. SG-1]|uniref:DUF5694 domain-containing protein n=1 Tax=Bacillus sp. SG-1 TaxID=161544 RepID=UPI0012EA8E1C|nr:DUF5694 domain-containing protein [Bacillus sp. SG-1]